jgi:hypothetical protein
MTLPPITSAGRRRLRGLLVHLQQSRRPCAAARPPQPVIAMGRNRGPISRRDGLYLVILLQAVRFFNWDYPYKVERPAGKISSRPMAWPDLPPERRGVQAGRGAARRGPCCHSRFHLKLPRAGFSFGESDAMMNDPGDVRERLEKNEWLHGPRYRRRGPHGPSWKAPSAWWAFIRGGHTPRTE